MKLQLRNIFKIKEIIQWMISGIQEIPYLICNTHLKSLKSKRA